MVQAETQSCHAFPKSEHHLSFVLVLSIEVTATLAVAVHNLLGLSC